MSFPRGPLQADSRLTYCHSKQTYGPLQLPSAHLMQPAALLEGPGGTWRDLVVAWWLPWGCLESTWGDLKYNNFVIAIYLYICFVILL